MVKSVSIKRRIDRYRYQQQISTLRKIIKKQKGELFSSTKGDKEIRKLNLTIDDLYKGLGQLVNKIRSFKPKKETFNIRKFGIIDPFYEKKVKLMLEKRE